MKPVVIVDVTGKLFTSILIYKQSNFNEFQNLFIQIPVAFIILTPSAPWNTHLFTSSTQLQPISIRFQVKLLILMKNKMRTVLIQGYFLKNRKKNRDSQKLRKQITQTLHTKKRKKYHIHKTIQNDSKSEFVDMDNIINC